MSVCRLLEFEHLVLELLWHLQVSLRATHYVVSSSDLNFILSVNMSTVALTNVDLTFLGKCAFVRNLLHRICALSLVSMNELGLAIDVLISDWLRKVTMLSDRLSKAKASLMRFRP